MTELSPSDERDPYFRGFNKPKFKWEGPLGLELKSKGIQPMSMTIQSEHCVACCKKFCHPSEAKML